MKVLRNVLIAIFASIWFVIALFVTICLLSYNEFKVTTFGKTTLLIIDSDELEPEYSEGDLLVVKRNSDSKINVGDFVFFYNNNMNSKILVNNGVIQNKVSDANMTETTYEINGQRLSGEFVIGTKSSTKVYHKWGGVLGILTSKWGFMFFVIFPALFAIIYEIVMIVETVKEPDEA